MPVKCKSQNEIIRTQAIQFIQLLKGSNISEQDIIFAEELISFGYMIGLSEIKVKEKPSQVHLINLGIINSEWGQTT